MKYPKFITIVLHKDGSYSLNTSKKDFRFKPKKVEYKKLFNMKLKLSKREYNFLLRILKKHEVDLS